MVATEASISLSRDSISVTTKQVIVLMPSREAIASREAGREAKGYGRWTVDEMYELFAAGTPRIGSWIDTTTMTPDETVDFVLETLDR